MADRYWRGGTGTWNTTSTTNWSDTSGGTGGFSVPTASDNVFFDQAATYNVTMTGALACLNITVSAGTVSFLTGTGPTLQVNGSMSLIAMTWTSTGAITFNATTTGQTITTNATTINGAITFNGVGGVWSLGSALTTGATTTTFKYFSLDGIAGNLVTVGSATTANHTLSMTSGVANTQYMSISRSTATGGAGWIAATSTNGANNAGWVFAAPSFVEMGDISFDTTDGGITFT